MPHLKTQTMFKSVFKLLPTCLLIGLTATLAQAAMRPGSANLTKPAIVPTPAAPSGSVEFHKNIEPLLKTYCYDCHGDGMKRGNVSLDAFVSNESLLDSHDLWWKALKNLRSGIMPPVKRPRPTTAEQERITQWIKTAVFRIEPDNPDPGRATVRRLNRVEYRNTIRDLMGVDYDTQAEFPPDDAGNGFDNIGAALTLSPMLLEKYLNAAQTIVAQAVPTVARVLAAKTFSGASFHPAAEAANNSAVGTRSLSYYEAATVGRAIGVEHPGHYQLVLDLSANEKYVDNKFDYNKCRLIFKADGQELLRQEYNREGGKLLHYEFDAQWAAGEHKLTFELQPLTPGVEQVRALALRVHTVTLRGPFEAQYQVETPNYRRFFPKLVPASLAGRHAYARALLGDFARRAFRRPLNEKLLTRLTGLAEAIYTQPEQSFESGVAQAMVAVLASPRFLFREEGVAPAPDGKSYPLVDEYTLASRLSYFLWSSMPDDELFRLAGQGLLRRNLTAQAQRMLADSRSAGLIQNFSGQWLQTRDIETVPINARAVFARERTPGTGADDGGDQGGPPRVRLDDALRKDLHHESDLYFDYIVHGDRNVAELIDSNYTFLNARLARYYDVANLNGSDEFRKVTLPAASPRGGVLTMGSVLAVTSNPTRTSPVKRGLFILDNVLGSPAPPPPANIPPLENAEAGLKHQPTLREALAIHRAQPLCASCHNRLDPPGLALENFNALGLWRDQEHGQPIEAGGTLITGEAFSNVREMKHILANQHSTDFYRCLTEKMLTYAVGRGLEDYDVGSVDRIVDGLEHNNGHFSTLLMGIIESAPFQKSRNLATSTAVKPPNLVPVKTVSPHTQGKSKP